MNEIMVPYDWAMAITTGTAVVFYLLGRWSSKVA